MAAVARATATRSRRGSASRAPRLSSSSRPPHRPPLPPLRHRPGHRKPPDLLPSAAASSHGWPGRNCAGHLHEGQRHDRRNCTNWETRNTTGIRRADVASGVYDNARIDLFATSWRTPVEDEEPLGFGFLGKTTLRDDRLAAEIMSAQDVLGQAVGETFGPMCKLEFGGTEFGGCQKPIGPITVTGTLTSVTDAGQFADSARAEAADYFTAGLLSFTSGANAGLKAQEIKLHASGGAFTLHEPFYYTPAIGDAYTLVPGCRKRLADCVAWGNVARFGGFPHVPTSTTYTKVGTAS